MRDGHEDFPGATRAPRRRKAMPVLAVVVLTAFAVGAAAGYVESSLHVGPQPEPSPSSIPSAQTDPHGRLVSRLPAAVFSGCAPEPSREGGKRTAAVTCSSPMPGADELLVTQWADGPSMLADFASFYGTKPDGKCGDYAGTPSTGRRSTWDGGPLACYVNSQGAAILLWEYSDLGVQVLAVRRDRDHKALFSWWRDAARNDPT